MGFRLQDNFYIPESDDPRLSKYTEYEQIFLGDHKLAFNPTIPENGMYIVELFGQLTSYISADLLFGESVSVTTNEDEGQEFLDSFYDNNKDFDTRLYEASLSDSYMGDTIVEMWTDDDGNAHPRFIDPRHWVPVFDGEGEVKEHQLNFILQHEDSTFLWRRTHRVGTLTNELFRITSIEIQDKITEMALVKAEFSSIGMPNVQDEQETGVSDDFIIKQIPNMRLINRVFGLSDYIGKGSLMNALNMLTSFATYVLERHADPTQVLPEGGIEAMDKTTDSSIKIIEEGEETKGMTRYITWDAQLIALYEQRTHVVEALALYSEISLGLLGKDKNGSVPESGRALKIKYARTLQKIARKQRYWSEGIQWILNTAQEMEGKATTDFVVTFGDGLPEDLAAFLEEKVIEKNLGVKTNETLTREILQKQGWTNERIDEELERLKEVAATQVTAPRTDLFTRKVEIDGKKEDK